MLKTLAVLVLLIALFTGLSLWRAARHEARAEAAHPPLGQILEIDGHKVHALVMGPDDGSVPDLVLIHGSSGNLRDFSFSLMAQLAQDYRVFAFDRPGLGYSDRINRTGASLAMQARHLARAAERLGAQKPLVLGQSYGGAVALAWALERPDFISGLVTVSAPSHPWDTGLGLFYEITSHPWLGPAAITLITAWVDDARISAALREIFLPQQEPEGYDAYIGTGLTLTRHALRANALQRRNLLGEIKAMQPRYDTLTLPIEIVHGDDDCTVPHWNHAERFKAQVPAANLTLLPGIGHMPHHVAQPQVIAAIHRATTRAGLR